MVSVYIQGRFLKALLLLTCQVQNHELLTDSGTGVATLNGTLLFVFTFEVILKIVAFMNPWQEWSWFYDPWTAFDTIIVVMSHIPFTPKGLLILRVLRLFRVLKEFNSLPQLQMIVNGLIDAITGLWFVTLLLVMTVYFYGIIGIQLFSANDYMFRSLHYALLNLASVATEGSWPALMYTNMYGCRDYYRPGHRCCTDVPLLGNDTRPFYDLPPEMQALCPEHVPQPVTAAVFFVSFRLLVAFIILKLVVGTIIVSLFPAPISTTHSMQQHLFSHARWCLRPVSHRMFSCAMCFSHQCKPSLSFMTRSSRSIRRSSSCARSITLANTRCATGWKPLMRSISTDTASSQQIRYARFHTPLDPSCRPGNSTATPSSSRPLVTLLFVCLCVSQVDGVVELLENHLDEDLNYKLHWHLQESKGQMHITEFVEYLCCQHMRIEKAKAEGVDANQTALLHADSRMQKFASPLGDDLEDADSRSPNKRKITGPPFEEE